MKDERRHEPASRHAPVDIVVVTYRSADAIAACLDSIPGSLRESTVVVDNNSPDASADIAASLGVTVLRNPDNAGFGAAANQGAATGRADVVLFLNPDARLRPDTIGNMLGAFEDPLVAVVGARLRYPDESEQTSLWRYPSPRQMWSEAFGLFRGREPKRGFVVGACLMVRRTALEALGGFDERFWLYGEEADLCFRAERAGWRVVRASEATADHEGGASGRETSELVAEHFARGAELFVLKHSGGLGLLSYRVAALTASAIRWPALRVRSADDPRLVFRSRHIRRTLRMLRTRPFSVASGSPRVGREQLVVVSLEAWDKVWRRNQFLVRELLALRPALQVLWVEPPHDPIHEALRRRSFPRLRTRRLRPVEGEPRVMRFQPRKWLPRSVWPWIDASLIRQVRRAAHEAGFTSPLLWINDNTYAGLVGKVDWRTTYDITDDWLDSALAPRARARQEAREARLVGAADEVVVCSPALAERRGSQRPVHLLPNAVDAGHFQRPRLRPADLPAGATAVYVGSLHEDRIDVALVERIADELPGLAIVLVGPNSLSRASVERLTRRRNVSLLGPRAYDEVPAYLQHAAAVIVPHVVTPFTESLDPIKAYECLAVGRPTLATPVAGFRELEEPIRTASAERFVAELRSMLLAPPPAGAASPPSWSSRALEFWGVLTGASTAGAPARRFNVTYVGHTAVASGGELALVRLLRGLQHVDATVILGEDGPIVPKLRGAGARVEVLPMPGAARTVHRDSVTPRTLPFGAAVASVRYSLQLARRLRADRPDIVHTNTLKAAFYAGLAARLAQVPLVWHVRDRIADDYLPAPTVRAIRLLAKVLPDAIITNSEATRDALDTSRRVSTVAPSPVVYDPVELGELAWPEGDLVVGMVGRLSPWKGQDVFLRAFAAAFPEGRERALIVGGALFGEDDYEATVRSLALELGIGDRVEFTGHVDDVTPFMSQMHVVVHASTIPEPFGQVVVEALAAGRAVIASNEGGPSEIVTDGVNGLLVPPGDVESLAAAMRRLASDQPLRERFAANGLKRARDFAPERIGPLVERIYRRLSDGR